MRCFCQVEERAAGWPVPALAALVWACGSHPSTSVPSPALRDAAHESAGATGTGGGTGGGQTGGASSVGDRPEPPCSESEDVKTELRQRVLAGAPCFSGYVYGDKGQLGAQAGTGWEPVSIDQPLKQALEAAALQTLAGWPVPPCMASGSWALSISGALSTIPAAVDSATSSCVTAGACTNFGAYVQFDSSGRVTDVIWDGANSPSLLSCHQSFVGNATFDCFAGLSVSIGHACGLGGA
jgi:hypothetical protein